MKILLLIDIQNDFCPGGTLAVTDGDQIVQVANRLMASGEFKHIIASKDWHPVNHKSFASNQPDHELFESIDIEVQGRNLSQTLWPDHCLQNSPGAEFHPELDTSKIEKIIYKGTQPEIDSYSAFFDNGRLHETNLRSYIEQICKSEKIEWNKLELVICGLATDYCVGFTASDAKSLGLNTTIVLDACRAVNLNPGDELQMLRNLTNQGVQVVLEKDLLGISQPIAIPPRTTAMDRCT